MCDVIAGTTLQLQRAETRVPSARAVLLASRRAAYRSWFRESRPRSHSTAVSVPYLGWGLIRNPQVSKKRQVQMCGFSSPRIRCVALVRRESDVWL